MSVTKEQADQLILDAVPVDLWSRDIKRDCSLTPSDIKVEQSENVKRIRSNSVLFAFNPLR